MKKDDKLYIRKVLFTSKLTLVLVLGYMVVRTVTLSGYVEKGLAPTSALGGDKVYVGETIESPVLSLEDYAEIIERNPFGTSGQTTDVGKWASMGNLTGSGDSISEELGLALFGTIAGNPAVARAIIKDLKTGVFDMYKIGQTVAGARIESIDTDAVILTHNGERKILGLNIGKYSSNNDNNAQVSSYHTINERDKALKTNLPDEHAPGEVRTKMGCVETILKEAIIEPYVADDQVEGLRITGLENIPAAKDIGLKNGDILRMVNGHRLTDKQKAYQVFKKARSQAAINLELLRGDETKKLSFALP